jgi:sarcosine oxidase
MESPYDVIVIGAGGVGSAALWHLARQGARVLGLDRFPAGHDRGSSHGHTRVIRQAYFEHPDYVPLLREAYARWDELEKECGESLFHRTGLLEVGPPDGIVIPGVLASARQHQLDIEVLTPREARARYPGFQLDDDVSVAFERNAGYLLVERCVVAHLRVAQQLGAFLDTQAEVVGWRRDAGGIEVETTKATYRADRLIITAGAWAGGLLADLGLPLRVVRKHLHWYATTDPKYHEQQGCPVFFFEVSGMFYYGFPEIDQRGVKVAEHSGGVVISDPLADRREVDSDERQRVERFLQQHLPGVSRRSTDHAVCFYTMSPDENFFVDRHPEDPRIVFAAGLSGHGFKFASALGKILADLALHESTPLSIDFLRAARPFPATASRFHDELET